MEYENPVLGICIICRIQGKHQKERPDPAAAKEAGSADVTLWNWEGFIVLSSRDGIFLREERRKIT